tara:strand:- start:1435 stop:1755 length:321 start_codon:yes stop_codon:yes gene_type:complete
MKMTLQELGRRSAEVEKIFIESVDLSLYIAQAVINGEEHLLADNNGKVLKRINLLAMKRCLKAQLRCQLVLRHRSAYDEMVGHNYSANSNTMELPLGDQPLPDWLN